MGDAQRRALTADNRQFMFSTQPEFSKPESGVAQRKFTGVAYSGNVISNHWYWGNVVFDMNSMSLPDKLPALIDHDRSLRCGYVTNYTTSEANGLEVQGTLLSNAHGSSVAQESDEGFPWQMSVNIEPGSVEEVNPGQDITVNGRALTGPLVVFRNSKIVEVSFTATGWDSNTSAAAMSRSGETTHSSQQGDPEMDLKQLQDRVAELEATNQTLQTANTDLTTKLAATTEQLTAFSKSARTADVKRLFADLGREYKDDDADVLSFSAMPQDAFDASAKLLRDAVAKQDKPGHSPLLFQHQAHGGRPPEQQPTNPLLADAERRVAQFSKRARA